MLPCPQLVLFIPQCGDAANIRAVRDHMFHINGYISSVVSLPFVLRGLFSIVVMIMGLWLTEKTSGGGGESGHQDMDMDLLQGLCHIFNLWKCMERMKRNCETVSDHFSLSSWHVKGQRVITMSTLCWIGRESINPGEKQMKPPLRPALHHTMAYINVWSSLNQVNKRLEHLHLQEGQLSRLCPPPPRSPSS